MMISTFVASELKPAMMHLQLRSLQDMQQAAPLIDTQCVFVQPIHFAKWIDLKPDSK